MLPGLTALSLEAAKFAAAAMNAAISRTGHAAAFMSGGTTPRRMLEHLASERLDWARVTIGLVDERWVAPDDPQSNEHLIRSCLLTGAAGAAGLLPMKTAHESPLQAEVDRNAAYAPHCVRPAFVLLGLGADGHTASWFPGSPELAEVVSVTQEAVVKAVHAPSAATPLRMTLTSRAVSAADQVLILCFGAEKRSILEETGSRHPLDRPIGFVVGELAERLTIYWAE
jgi:6-phosphogluconolactonase